MMPTEVAVAGAFVPELIRGIDGWGIPLEPGPIPVVVPAGVGIMPIPVEPVSVALGINPLMPLVMSLTTEPSKPPSPVVVGLAVGDTAGTLTGNVEFPEVPVEVVVGDAGMVRPRLSRRPPWEEVVAAAVEEPVTVAVVLEFEAVAPRRFETSDQLHREGNLWW